MPVSPYGWLYPEPGTYTAEDFLWLDPFTVMDRLGLDYDDPDTVRDVADLIAEASLILDTFTGRQYGPSRCVAATFRLKGMPTLHFAPPIGTVIAVVLYDDTCYSSDPAATVEEILQRGTVIPPQGAGSGAALSYCTDTPHLMRLCGVTKSGMSQQWGASALCGTCADTSPLVTVVYRTRANWPPGTQRALMALVRALQDDTCSLPATASSVSRQGVTWSLDATKQITGVAYVDQWLQRHRRGLRLKDPAYSPLVSYQYVDCTPPAPRVVPG